MSQKKHAEKPQFDREDGESDEADAPWTWDAMEEKKHCLAHGLI